MLHRNGLIHGDVSPRNLIVSGSELVLTDFDFVTRIGEPLTTPGTVLYASPSAQERRPASPADDIFALAASFFHVLFEREPFRHGGEFNKQRGLNWDGIDRSEYPCLVEFLDRATHPDPQQRFVSVADALECLKPATLEGIQKKDDQKSLPTCIDVPTIPAPPTVQLLEQRVDWLRSPCCNRIRARGGETAKPAGWILRLRRKRTLKPRSTSRCYKTSANGGSAW